MDDYAQYSNMMNQINQINSSQKEVVNEKKEDMQEKLAEYKKTLEMTTEGIGGGILHDVGMNLIKKGFSAIKDKLPIPADELESMVADYKDGGAKKMFDGMTKRGYSKAKQKIFGDEENDNAVTKVFGNLFKKPIEDVKASDITDDEPPPPPAEDSLEPNFDNIGSTDEYKVQNKLLKDKVKSLDKDTQKQIKSDVDNDPLIKKTSEIKKITDPDEKLAEQTKRGKALNDRVNEEAPEAPAQIQEAPKPSAPLRDEEAFQDDPAKSDFQNLLDKKQGDLLKGGGLDDDDQDIFQAPKSISQKITSVLGGDEDEDLTDTIKTTAKKAGEKFLETDAELGGPEDPFGDVLSGIVGLGTLLGGVFGAKSKHLKGNFPAYVPINPTFQSGA
tara:strand:+ start:9247 stop:10407 length:1161 start_codon:yes stop_codon:yes gene_type:complete